jgi:hypothetical protein
VRTVTAAQADKLIGKGWFDGHTDQVETHAYTARSTWVATCTRSSPYAARSGPAG